MMRTSLFRETLDQRVAVHVLLTGTSEIVLKFAVSQPLSFQFKLTCIQEGWRKLMTKVLVVYGPTEFVISKGTEHQATAAVRSWLTREKRAGNVRPGWHIGRQDLLALSIRRGFLGCMELLMDQFSHQELLSHWEENQWQPGCYPHIAVSTGRTAVLQLLHRRGMNIDQADWQGRTPLIAAVRESQAQVADYLLSVGVRRDVKLLLTTRNSDDDDYGAPYTMFMIEWAAYHGTLDMVETWLLRASEETVRLLIDNGARHTLKDHAINENVEMVGTYLAYGAELYPPGNRKIILCFVAIKGHVEVCKLLLEFLLPHGAAAKSLRHEPLLAAIKAYTPRCDPWAHPDKFADTTKAAVSLLIAHAADVNAESSSYGRGAPLHTVVNLGFLDIAERPWRMAQTLTWLWMATARLST
ncbi:ankyrin repeat-containing domain protein [Aspergillus germanicus]